MNAQPDGEPASEPLSITLRRLIAQSMTAAECRLALASLELGEERERIGRALLRGLLATLLSFLSVQLLVMLAVALTWDSVWRIPVIVGFVVASLVAAGLAVRASLATPVSRLFEGSAREFANDVRAADGPT